MFLTFFIFHFGYVDSSLYLTSAHHSEKNCFLRITKSTKGRRKVFVCYTIFVENLLMGTSSCFSYSQETTTHDSVGDILEVIK